MLRKATITAATLIVAATTAVAPAMACENHADKGTTAVQDNAPAVEKPAKPTEAEKAELTSKRLDNAKKGVETAKAIVDTLGGLGSLFGFGK